MDGREILSTVRVKGGFDEHPRILARHHWFHVVLRRGPSTVLFPLKGDGTNVVCAMSPVPKEVLSSPSPHPLPHPTPHCDFSKCSDVESRFSYLGLLMLSKMIIGRFRALHIRRLGVTLLSSSQCIDVDKLQCLSYYWTGWYVYL